MCGGDPFACNQAGRPTRLLPQGEAACNRGSISTQSSIQANPPAPARGGRVHRRSPLRAAKRAGQPTCSRRGRPRAPAVPFARSQAGRPTHLLPQGEAACTGGPLCAQPSGQANPPAPAGEAACNRGSLSTQSSIQANPPAPARGGQVHRRFPLRAIKHTGQSTCSRRGRPRAPAVPFARNQAYRPIHLLPQGAVRCTGGSLSTQSSIQANPPAPARGGQVHR